MLRRTLFVSLGFIFLVFGIAGIFLPVLPTTPFLILTAICFNKGSERFHKWLMIHPLLSPPILDWQKNRVIRPRYKILATMMMLGSFILISQREAIPVIGKASFAVFIVGVMTYIWTRKGTPRS